MSVRKIRNYLGRNFKKSRSDDVNDTEKRSALMAKIKSRGTKFEKDFLKELKIKTKIKFKTNVAKLKGKPDIVFVKEKVCVFLDSDFWHGWQFGRWKNLMKNDFWVDKITNNRLRDRKTTGYLRKRGWRVLRFWEHSIKNNPNRVFEKIIQTLELSFSAARYFSSFQRSYRMPDSFGFY